MKLKPFVMKEPLPPLEETGPLLLPREMWGGKPLLKARKYILLPARFLFHRTMDDVPEKEYLLKPYNKIAWLQNRHRQINNRSDIKYNFIIGTDGYVYEGRGWTIRPDLWGKSYDDFPDIITEDLFGTPLPAKSLLIGYMKNEDNDEKCTNRMQKATDALLYFGLYRGYISKTYKTYSLEPTGMERIQNHYANKRGNALDDEWYKAIYHYPQK